MSEQDKIQRSIDTGGEVTTRKASCICGKLTVTTKGPDPERISLCHCKNCQKQTGSAFAIQATFPKEQVTIEGKSTAWKFPEGAKPVTYRNCSRSGATFYFCPVCGSTVYYVIAETPDFIGVKVGAFTDPTFPPPNISGFEEYRFPWAINVAALPMPGGHHDQRWANPFSISGRYRLTFEDVKGYRPSPRTGQRSSTLASLVGEQQRVPDDRPIDGVDASAFLTGSNPTTGRDHVIYFGSDAGVMSVKWRTMKVVFRYSNSTSGPVIKPQWPLVFDLIDDPMEEWDLIEKRLDCAWVLAPVAERLGAFQQSVAQYPNIKPGQEFTGYS